MLVTTTSHRAILTIKARTLDNYLVLLNKNNIWIVESMKHLKPKLICINNKLIAKLIANQ